VVLKPYIWPKKEEPQRHASVNPMFRSDMHGPGAQVRHNMAYVDANTPVDGGPIFLDDGGYDRAPAPGALLSDGTYSTAGTYSKPEDYTPPLDQPGYEAVDLEDQDMYSAPRLQHHAQSGVGYGNMDDDGLPIDGDYLDVGQDGEPEPVYGDKPAYGDTPVYGIDALGSEPDSTYGLAESAGIQAQDMYNVPGVTPVTANFNQALYESSSAPALPIKARRLTGDSGTTAVRGSAYDSPSDYVAERTEEGPYGTQGHYGAVEAAVPQYHIMPAAGLGASIAHRDADLEQCAYFHNSIPRAEAEHRLRDSGEVEVGSLETHASHEHGRLNCVARGFWFANQRQRSAHTSSARLARAASPITSCTKRGLAIGASTRTFVSLATRASLLHRSHS
jgi:hypothetical protein